MPGEIISERRATSNRNAGRHHRGFAGDFLRNPHLQDRNRSSALDERTLRDSGICRSDTLYLDSKQIERDTWLDILHFPPF
jgi:hypothetical protein